MNDFGPYADRDDVETLNLLLKNSYDISKMQGLESALADPVMANTWILRKQHADGVKHLACPVETPQGFYFRCCDIHDIYGCSIETRDEMLAAPSIKERAVEGEPLQWREQDNILLFEPGSTVFPEIKAQTEKEMQETAAKLVELGESADFIPVEQYNQLGARYQFLCQQNNPVAKLLAALQGAGIATAVEIDIPGVEAAQLTPNKPTLH